MECINPIEAYQGIEKSFQANEIKGLLSFAWVTESKLRPAIFFKGSSFVDWMARGLVSNTIDLQGLNRQNLTYIPFQLHQQTFHFWLLPVSKEKPPTEGSLLEFQARIISSVKDSPLGVHSADLNMLGIKSTKSASKHWKVLS